MFAGKRLSKELLKMQEHLPPGITLVKSDNLEEWQMDIRVLDENPLYRGQVYRLKFTFSSKYPIEPPEVQFIQCPPRHLANATNTSATTSTSIDPQSHSQSQTQSDQPETEFRPIPIHPHIYSNGIICLDLLSSAGWSPVQTVESVGMSIQSMLTTNTRNERPEGDSTFVSMNRRRPRDISFQYDDDNV